MGWLGVGSVGHGEFPAVVGEFAGDGDGGHAVVLASVGSQALPAAVQASLGAPGAVDGPGFLAGLAALQRLAEAWRAPVVPGGFDEQPAGVGGAGLGDRALAALVAGGVFGR